MPRIHARVHGLVQGVGFRAWTRLHATRLGLRGYVRNLPDGSVEVTAFGDKESLEMLVSLLKTGPPGCKVTSLDADRFGENDQDAPVPPQGTGFEIRY